MQANPWGSSKRLQQEERLREGKGVRQLGLVSARERGRRGAEAARGGSKLGGLDRFDRLKSSTVDLRLWLCKRAPY